MALHLAAALSLGPGRVLSHVGADGDPCPDAQALSDQPPLLRRVGHRRVVLGGFRRLRAGPLSFLLSFVISHLAWSQRPLRGC